MSVIIAVYGVLAFLASGANCLGRGQCSRTASQTHTSTYCEFNFLGCWVRNTYRYTTYYTERYCCNGYTDSGGRCIPKCPGGCGSGTCIAPYRCNCGSSRTGANCNELSQKPSVMTSNASLELYDAASQAILYSLTIVPQKDEPISVVRWTNREQFNRMDISMEAFLDLGNLPSQPSYVQDSRFGIKSAQISYSLTKGSGGGNRLKRLTCKSSISRIQSGVYSCQKHVPNLNYRLGNADVLSIRFEVASGGYMRLNDGTTEQFAGSTAFKTFNLTFDFIPPHHCQDDNSCVEDGLMEPLKVVRDITKDTIELKWSGWSDKLSGLHSYVLEIFNITSWTVSSVESVPIYTRTLDVTIQQHNNLIMFSPNGPAMYVAKLGVNDNANNTRQIHAFFLYDTTSAISLEPTKNVRVTSASPESGYHWQVSNTHGKTSLEVDWTGRFVNTGLETGGFLASAFGDFQQVKINYKDTIRKKYSRDPWIIDWSGESRQHIHGIDRFEFQFTSFEVNAKAPTLNWKRHSTLSEKATVLTTVRTGECLLAWVKAFDILGNIATDNGMVCFDSSTPDIHERSFELDRNVKGKTYSRLTFQALDQDSGIAMVTWGYKNAATNTIAEISENVNLSVPGNKTRANQEVCVTSGECYCISTGDCFSKTYHLDIDHSVICQPNNPDSKTDYIVTLSVYNQARQKSSFEFLIKNVQTLNGLQACQTELTSGFVPAIVVVCICIVIAGLVFYIYKTGRLQKIKEMVGCNQHSESTGGHQLNLDGDNKVEGQDEDYIYMEGGPTGGQCQEWKFSVDDMTVSKLITIGKFAKIHEANLMCAGRHLTVVAKMLKDGYTEEDATLMEMKITFFHEKVGKHSSVLEMIGAITDNTKIGPVMILERCGYGSMKDWLNNNKNRVDNSAIDLLFQFIYAIVRGMEYLASLEIIHMRLAARNVLLTDNLEPKIAGFGPRRGDDNVDGEKKERIPVKWLPPECISKMSRAVLEKSDVWSNAVVMWEIFTFGDAPYPNIKSTDLPNALKRGERLPQPEYSDDTHYGIMTKSWNIDPAQRPTFREIREEIEKTYNGSADYTYYHTSAINE
ncbi:uncharacterized protein [Argopecten irradians]|uniref:uncharacterized protein isoform X2 n=1 Tax=Argopecten irradians TaxID=31199 RepID=UPI003712E2E0